jgi:hypothetical protein
MTMRKIILTILFASSAAMPALAQDQGGRYRDRDRDSSETSRSEEARPERAQRAERVERAEQPQRERPQVSERANWSDRGAERQRAVEQQAAHQVAVEQRGERRSWQQRRSDQPVVEQRSQDNGDSDARRALRDRFVSTYGDGRQGRRDATTRDGVVIQRDRDQRDGYQSRDGRVSDRRGRDDRTGTYSRTNTRWTTQWRNDRTYDWRRHRDSHRSIYRLGYYRDPYGSRYRRFSIGFSLFPSYYRSSYWLDDPWMYRLPPAYGPYRWVRYYGDALLVNIYTGQVVDVVYDFFW